MKDDGKCVLVTLLLHILCWDSSIDAFDGGINYLLNRPSRSLFLFIFSLFQKTIEFSQKN